MSIEQETVLVTARTSEKSSFALPTSLLISIMAALEQWQNLSMKNRPSSFLNRRHTQTLGFESKCMILFMIAEP